MKIWDKITGRRAHELARAKEENRILRLIIASMESAGKRRRAKA